ncbi:gp04 [Rhodococcus phage ReqiPine5]|uniref:Gp04 n=1 Tax=Rhodococcus phage ReqiPine5 TaxID=691963 RepID=D4P7X9_9CAUD|nr:gp04 [Rhodococcus phage ReqiPine5]ADD81109.1 gp04 [Rhodococcus phage ReqiPine5]
MSVRTIGLLSAIGLVASVVGANYATSTWGMVPVGFGYVSTAGTFIFGATLVTRDAVQDALGKWAMWGVVLLGALVSLVVADPAIAVASTAAFVTAEVFAWAVYTPIRNRSTFGDRRWAAAVIAAAIVGAVLDTVVFLALAFGFETVTLHAVIGQLIGKGYAVAAYLAIGAAYRRTTT